MQNFVSTNPARNRTADSFNNPRALNDATYFDFYNRLKLLATTAFEWKGMPESINLRFLESALFMYGMAIFAKPTKIPLDYVVAKCTVAGALNVYDEPVNYHAFGIGYSEDFRADDCVLIRNNPIRYSTHATVELFARRLYEVERSLDTNIKGQKFPIVLVGTNSQILTLKNIYAQYDGNYPVIYADKSLDLEGIKAINTDSPFVADKLMSYKHDIWNEAMSFLGINNANTDKRERLITDEVTANDQLVQLAAEAMLATRREAAKAISKMYGLSVTVEQKQTESAELPEQPDYSEAGKDGGTE
jgi:hypothetical protein